MTKKTIMIDDVDVAECEFYNKVVGEDAYCNIDEEHLCTCISYDNCYYKQLKRKEQECEELKKEIGLTSCANIELSLEVKKYEKAIEKIEEIADNNYENREMERIFTIIGGLDV